ncbi:hypothetical protein GpartN1_g7667.t1 [Galdieria partita]|uniref:DNA-3-methyladenine glycosylase II n=1 Tax=Galdieria partita TaxID=83374 RepID=A0A9C7Q480_9RHOD|nr:hypothetical protein GpartN1_g7667.t1 [Galdieria partita]
MLTAQFFGQETVQVAKQLLGKRLVRHYDDEQERTTVVLMGRIIEVEAYLGSLDRACHSYGGRRTARTEPMFQAPGTVYIYFVYGMHYCFNISTGKPGEAILIRALFPLQGITTMCKLRKQSNLSNLCNGPAKLCQAFGLDKRLNQTSVCAHNSTLYVDDDDGYCSKNIIATPRIGVAYAQPPWSDAKLRFYLECMKEYTSVPSDAKKRREFTEPER